MVTKKALVLLTVTFGSIILLINIFLSSYSFTSDNHINCCISNISNPQQLRAKYNQCAIIPCNINGENVTGCLAFAEEPYVRFHLVQKHCEVEGIATTEEVLWRHTNLSVHQLPMLEYRSDGPFMYFHEYNVELRSRVLLISPNEGVPLSSQWDPRGYFYPIQIAQFALSHYSKLRLNSGDLKSSSVKEKLLFANLSLPTTSENKVALEVASSDPESRAVCLLARGEWIWNNSAIGVTVSADQGSMVELIYSCVQSQSGTPWVSGNANLLIFQICDAASVHTMHLVRNLPVDYTKALLYLRRSKRPRGHLPQVDVLPLQWRVHSVTVYGRVHINEMQLRSGACHKEHFLQAAEWFLKRQDSQGGFAVPVARRLNGRVRLQPPWYSAMAQGHAMSVLVRAYHMTQEDRFRDATIRCQSLFHKDVANGGVRSHLVSPGFAWYEEYPTTPSLYVLNGFIFSLMGLYDLNTIHSDVLTQQLYSSGLNTLRHFLPLFDTGSGSLYDLRHWSDPLEFPRGPNRARWEYHAVHVAQLRWLQMVDPDTPLWRLTADRWQGYMRGLRSPHN